MNENNNKRAIPTWPTWLDARTIAILTTTMTVALALGTMVQTALAGMGGEIDQLRQELRTDIENVRTDLSADIGRLDRRVDKLDDRLRSVEVGVVTISDDIGRLDDRVDKLDDRVSKLDDRVSKLDDRVSKLDDRVRSVEVGVAAIRTAMGFDARLRVVEVPAADADKAPGPDGHDG